MCRDTDDLDQSRRVHSREGWGVGYRLIPEIHEPVPVELRSEEARARTNGSASEQQRLARSSNLKIIGVPAATETQSEREEQKRSRSRSALLPPPSPPVLVSATSSSVCVIRSPESIAVRGCSYVFPSPLFGRRAVERKKCPPGDIGP